MEILIFVCALGVSPAHCGSETALRNTYVQAGSPDAIGCLREGMIYAAQSGLVAAGTYPKVVCTPARQLARRAAE
jgi:hypothetical protein